MFHRSFLLVSLVAVLSELAGCGSSTSPRPAGPSPDLLSTSEMVTLCERLHHEVVSCAREFVTLNLDLRSMYSSEFAQQISDPAARTAAIEEGIAETASDAAHAQERCTEFAQPAWGPPQPRSDLEVLEGCYQQTACTAKMACLRPVIEPRFAYRAAHHGPQ